MNICFIIKMHYNRLLQMQNLHSAFTACTRRAHNAPTALSKTPQRCHSVLSNTLWKRQAAVFVLSMLKVNAATWRSRRLHSVAGLYTARTLAFCNFFNAVGTL